MSLLATPTNIMGCGVLATIAFTRSQFGECVCKLVDEQEDVCPQDLKKVESLRVSVADLADRGLGSDGLFGFPGRAPRVWPELGK